MRHVFPVSYTHLDVYKRQVLVFMLPARTGIHDASKTTYKFLVAWQTLITACENGVYHHVLQKITRP